MGYVFEYPAATYQNRATANRVTKGDVEWIIDGTSESEYKGAPRGGSYSCNRGSAFKIGRGASPYHQPQSDRERDRKENDRVDAVQSLHGVEARRRDGKPIWHTEDPAR